MEKYLVRDASDYDVIYFIIEIEEENWDIAKEYMNNLRENDEDNGLCDIEIMEEYWENNDIDYEIIELPDKELYL